MRDVSYFVACSLDGMIAGPNDAIDWLFTDDDYGFAEFYRSVDCLVMGRKTFDAALSFDPFPYAGKRVFVVTRTRGAAPLPDVEFVNDDPARVVRRLKLEPGGRVWVVGGGQVVAPLLDAGLVDELVLTIHPVTLGRGARLFETHEARNRWRLHSTRSYHNGLVQVTYRRDTAPAP